VFLYTVRGLPVGISEATFLCLRFDWKGMLYPNYLQKLGTVKAMATPNYVGVRV
jgi:hypothetical protein